MASRDSASEEAAAQVVTRVLGGSYEINDTGSAAGQYDVRITTADRRIIALEVTSFGGDAWKRTSAGIQAEHRRGRHASEGLNYVWQIGVPTGIAIRDLQPRLTALLRRLEDDEKVSASREYSGHDPTLCHAAAELEALRVNFVGALRVSSPGDQSRIVIAQSKRWVGTSESLSVALAGVFEKRDNQAKLATAEADERHLYILMEDEAAAGRFQSHSPLPPCPVDPEGVIDAVWVSPLFVPAYIFRTHPGGSDWNRFEAATGEEAKSTG